MDYMDKLHDSGRMTAHLAVLVSTAAFFSTALARAVVFGSGDAIYARDAVFVAYTINLLVVYPLARLVHHFFIRFDL